MATDSLVPIPVILYAARVLYAATDLGDSDDIPIPPVGALAYYVYTQIDLERAITDIITPANKTLTTRATNVNIIQQDGTVVTYDPNVAAINVEVGMVVAGEAATDIPFSEDFENSDWIKQGLTPTDNDLIGPDGGVSGTKFLLSNTDNRYRIYDGVPAIAGETAEFLFFVKAGSAEVTLVSLYSQACGNASSNFIDFIFSSKTLVATGPNYEAKSVVELANGWFEIRVKCTAITTGINNLIFIKYGNTGGENAPSPPIPDGSFAYGFGFNFGPNFNGPYIKAEGLPATRAATVATASGFIEAGVLWPTDNFRAGMGEAGKDIILDALTNGGVFFQNGNLTASIAGTDLQIEIGASVATIPVATVGDVLQAYAVLEAGQFYAEANLIRGAGVANPGFIPSNEFTQGSDSAGLNQFDGTPTFPTFLMQTL